MLTLGDLHIGQDAIIRVVGGEGELRHHLHPRRPQDHPADRQLAGQEKDKKGEQEEDKYIPE